MKTRKLNANIVFTDACGKQDKCGRMTETLESMRLIPESLLKNIAHILNTLSDEELNVLIGSSGRTLREFLYEQRADLQEFEPLFQGAQNELFRFVE